MGFVSGPAGPMQLFTFGAFPWTEDPSLAEALDLLGLDPEISDD
jgi:hypothetical protein